MYAIPSSFFSTWLDLNISFVIDNLMQDFLVGKPERYPILLGKDFGNNQIMNSTTNSICPILSLRTFFLYYFNTTIYRKWCLCIWFLYIFHNDDSQSLTGPKISILLYDTHFRLISSVLMVSGWVGLFTMRNFPE